MGKTLLSRVDPVTQGERTAAEIPIQENTLYVCPSPLYGYGLEILLRRLPESSALLCVEADPHLFAISYKALAGLPAQATSPAAVALIEACRPEEVCVFARTTWGQRRFRAVQEVRLGGGWQLFPQLYESFAAALRRELAVEWGNAMTMIRLGRLYAANLIRNVASFSDAKTVAALDFGSSPVLVLGAGHSLDATLDELFRRFSSSGANCATRERRPFRIICVDTCLPALRERGIEPDLAVILESQHWNLNDFTGLRGWNIDAAIDLSALPASTRVLGGERFFFATQWTKLALFSRLAQAGIVGEMLPPLGSVALNAGELALRVTRGMVLTAGIDFSYTVDSYHARGTPGHRQRARTQSRVKTLFSAAAAFREGTFPALSKNGRTVRSDPGMRTYCSLFQQQFGGQARLADIDGSGLPLGVKTVAPAEGFAILSGNAAVPQASGGTQRMLPAAAGDGSPCEREKIAAFARRELHALDTLKQALTGEIPLEPADLGGLLLELDYLWAHFPEYAGTGGGREPAADVSFLKRVRTEIDPFTNYWNMALESCTSHQPPLTP